MEVESYKNMLNLVEESRVALENEVSNLKKRLSESKDEGKKSEVLAVGVLKEKAELIEQLENTVGVKELQIAELCGELDQLKSKIREASKSLVVSEMENNTVTEKFKKLESDFEKKEQTSSKLAEELSGKISALKSDLAKSQNKNRDLQALLNNDNALSEVVSKISNLEQELEMKLDEVDVYALNLEESEFNNGQLETSVEELRKNLTEMSQKLIEQRQNNHSNDVLVITMKDKNSELTLLNSDLTEEVTKLKQENEFLK